MKGVFITLYGINNIGKTTQSKLLVTKLYENGFKAIYLKYPIYDIEPTGPYINKLLRDPTAPKVTEDQFQLWYVLNRYQFEPQLKKYLEEGFVVVAEDYSGTGISWGTAKGLDEDWIIRANEKLLKEDLAIMLEGKRDKKAVESNHIHEQNEDLIKKCTEMHEKMAERFGWKKVSVQEKMEDTANLIWNVVKSFMDNLNKQT